MQRFDPIDGHDPIPPQLIASNSVWRFGIAFQKSRFVCTMLWLFSHLLQAESTPGTGLVRTDKSHENHG